MSSKKYKPSNHSHYGSAIKQNRHYKRIQEYLTTFEKDTLRYNLINGYYGSLIMRPQSKKMTLRSLYLALNSAINFLKYCRNFKEQAPTQYALEGYLFLYYEQKTVLADFINFISQKYQYDLDLEIIPKAIFQRPKVSHQILKGRLIKIMQNPHDKHFKEPYIFRTIIGYLHWIHIPQNVFISLRNMHKSTIYEEYHIYLCEESFYLPEKIVQFLLYRQLNC